MAANPKTAVRFDFPYDPVMDARFAREADIALHTCRRSAPEAETRAALARAKRRRRDTLGGAAGR